MEKVLQGNRESLGEKVLHFRCKSWVVPLPSSSYHKDYYIFSRGSQPKPSFATGILGGGTTQCKSFISLKKKLFGAKGSHFTWEAPRSTWLLAVGDKL